MSALVSVSRVARSIAELAIRSSDQMPFVVVPTLDRFGSIGSGYAQNTAGIVGEIARPLGYDVVTFFLPTNPHASIADIGREASDALARTSGPTLIVLDAAVFDADSDLHVRNVAGLASLAVENWSMNGATFLLVISAEDPEPVASLVASTLGRADWVNSIQL